MIGSKWTLASSRPRVVSATTSIPRRAFRAAAATGKILPGFHRLHSFLSIESITDGVNPATKHVRDRSLGIEFVVISGNGHGRERR